MDISSPLSSCVEVSALESTAALLPSPRTRVMHLTDIGASDGMALAAHERGCRSLSEALQAVIARQTDGIPLFIQQLCGFGKDQGLFVVDADSGVADLSAALTLTGAEAVGSLLPASLEGLLAIALDRLDPPAQFLIKVASVHGPLLPQQPLHAPTGAGSGFADARGAAAAAGAGTAELRHPARPGQRPHVTLRHAAGRPAANPCAASATSCCAMRPTTPCCASRGTNCTAAWSFC